MLNHFYFSWYSFIIYWLLR